MMKKDDQINQEIEKTIESSKLIKKVQTPDGIYDSVMTRIDENKGISFGYSDVLKWAAVVLLVLVNAISYNTFLNGSYNQPDVTMDSEVEIENLVNEYSISYFSYDEY